MEAGNEVLLEVRHLKKYFPIRKGFFGKQAGVVKAVDDVSFRLEKGQVLGLVGESGCGKTTLGRLLLRAYEATDGEIKYHINNQDFNLLNLEKSELREIRKHIQMIFQDPYGSLNPRKTVLDIVGEPLRVNNICQGSQLQEQVKELMKTVGLETKYIRRYPHAFSGGQRQRIGIV